MHPLDISRHIFQEKETTLACALTSWPLSPSSFSSSPSLSPSACVSRSSINFDCTFKLKTWCLFLAFTLASISANKQIESSKHPVCVLMYGALFWSRENCSILRRRNKLIKSRTDHKRTVKWQPVWFGNLQLKLSFPTIKRVKFPGKQKIKKLSYSYYLMNNHILSGSARVWKSSDI